MEYIFSFLGYENPGDKQTAINALGEWKYQIQHQLAINRRKQQVIDQKNRYLAEKNLGKAIYDNLKQKRHLQVQERTLEATIKSIENQCDDLYAAQRNVQSQKVISHVNKEMQRLSPKENLGKLKNQMIKAQRNRGALREQQFQQKEMNEMIAEEMYEELDEEEEEEILDESSASSSKKSTLDPILKEQTMKLIEEFGMRFDASFPNSPHKKFEFDEEQHSMRNMD